MPLERARIDDQQQNMRLPPLFRAFAMADQHIAGDPDQVVGMVRDIGNDGAGLGQSIGPPGR